MTVRTGSPFCRSECNSSLNRLPQRTQRSQSKTNTQITHRGNNGYAGHQLVNDPVFPRSPADFVVLCVLCGLCGKPIEMIGKQFALEADAETEIRPVQRHVPDETVILEILIEVTVAGFQRKILGELPVRPGHRLVGEV